MTTTKGGRRREISACDYLHPSNITAIVYSFSASVLGATFPNPTDIRPVKQKYRAVQYRD